MPEPHLDASDLRALRKLAAPRSARSFRCLDRVVLWRLHAVGYVRLEFDWSTFKTMAVQTPEGASRLAREQARTKTALD